MHKPVLLQTSLDNFKHQSKLVMKQLLKMNPLIPFSAFLLVVGTIAGLLLTQGSTELRQQAAYAGCNPPAVQVVGGVDDGGCRCPNGEVIDPEENCSTSPTSIVVNPSNTPYCLQDGQTVGYGGVCCSGSSYQMGNVVVCGVAASTVTPTPDDGIGGITRYSCINSTCVQASTGDFLTVSECSESCRPSPTPTPMRKLYGERCTADNQCVTNYCENLSQTCQYQSFCPSSCAKGCYQTDGNNDGLLDCRPFCGLSCRFGCAAETSTGGVCEGCPKDSCVDGLWCGSDKKMTTIKCNLGQRSCDHFNTGVCVDNSPTPTPICKNGTYRCESGVEHYCLGNSEESTSCGNFGCDPRTNRCREISCSGSNGTVIDRNLNTYCCDGKISYGACDVFSLRAAGESCENVNNCIGGLTCLEGVCRQCSADSCVNGKWCGSDYKFTYPAISCKLGQKSCDNYSTGVCIENTPRPTITPVSGATCRRNWDCDYGYVCVRDTGDNTFACKPLPTPTKIPTPTNTPILNRVCRQNSDCSIGYICSKDSRDNTFACQPEVKTKDCWTYNITTKKCESFKSFSGLSCPSGSSPNRDVCLNPTPSPATAQIACFNRDQGYQQLMCVGNNVVACNLDTGDTEMTACPGGCFSLWGCFPPRPRESVCTPGMQWCEGNKLSTCSYTNARSDAAMIPHITSETCSYGCDTAINKCANPSSLTYLETFEQDIENKYGITIAVLSDDQTEVNYALITVGNVYKNAPKSLTNEVRSIVILPGTLGTGGETLMDGRVEFYECTEADFQSGKCESVAFHEIAHNTEQVPISNSHCPDGSSCQLLEGFVVAAGNDPHPIVFDAHGDLDVVNSDLQGMDSHSEANEREYLAQYTADYFLEPDALKKAHPVVYSFFQDVYHEYSK